MGRKSKRKKNPANQSGFTGRGAQRPEHAADHGPAVYRSAAPEIPINRNVVQANVETSITGEHTLSRGSLDRSLLHPSLRDLPDDAEIKVIMIPGDGSAPPGRAGDYLGILDKPYQMPDGEEVPAGSRVYRDLRPDEPAPGGGMDRVTVSRSSLTGDSGGFTGMDLAGHTRDLLDGVPWARGMKMGEVPFRVMNPEPGDEPITVHLNPADLHRQIRPPTFEGGRRLEVTSSGHGVPEWFDVHEPDPPPVHHLRAGDVLDIHARLAETMVHKPPHLLEFFDAYVSDTLDRAGKRGGDWEKVNQWAGMFWPAQTAAEWCDILAHQLKTARTYEVTAPMVETVHGLYEAVADNRIANITHDDLPWPAGFVYLDRASVFNDRFGNVIYNRAYSWDTVYLPYPEGKVPGIRIISWSHPQDRDSYWSPAVAEAMEASGGLGMGNTVLIPFGQRITAGPDKDGNRQDSVALWLRCLWFTLESVIGTTRPAPRADLGRHAIRRAQRTLNHTDVNVVLLRRALTLPPESSGEGSKSVRWTCRWFVDPFWRHVRRDPAWEAENVQYDEKGRVVRHHAIPDHTRERCAVCGARVSHIATFDKGPEGLPYKKTRQLQKLVR